MLAMEGLAIGDVASVVVILIGVVMVIERVVSLRTMSQMNPHRIKELERENAEMKARILTDAERAEDRHRLLEAKNLGAATGVRGAEGEAESEWLRRER